MSANVTVKKITADPEVLHNGSKDYRYTGSTDRKSTRLNSSHDPFLLAQFTGCNVRFINTKFQKGFCQIILNNKFIFINQNMSLEMQHMTCAHELGHLFLHREELKKRKRFAEMELFDITDRTELEANQFAANILIDDSELLSLIRSGYDMISTASLLNVNVNMLMVKILSLRNAGYDFDPPFYPDTRFMGKISDGCINE